MSLHTTTASKHILVSTGTCCVATSDAHKAVPQSQPLQPAALYPQRGFSQTRTHTPKKKGSQCKQVCNSRYTRILNGLGNECSQAEPLGQKACMSLEAEHRYTRILVALEKKLLRQIACVGRTPSIVSNSCEACAQPEAEISSLQSPQELSGSQTKVRVKMPAMNHCEHTHPRAPSARVVEGGVINYSAPTAAA